MNGVDVSGYSAHALLPPSQAKHSREPAAEKQQRLQAEILSRWSYIFSGCFMLILLIIGLCVWRCCKRRKVNRTKQMHKELGLEGHRDKNTACLLLDVSHSVTSTANSLSIIILTTSSPPSLLIVLQVRYLIVFQPCLLGLLWIALLKGDRAICMYIPR
jgi:hypothetical protein